MKENNFNKEDYIRKEKVFAIAVFAFIFGFITSVVTIFFMTSTAKSHENHDHGKMSHENMPSQDMMKKLAELEKHAMEHPNHADIWIEMGNIYFDLGQHNKAITAYEKSLKISPDNPNVLTDLGVMYRRSKQPRKALESFERAMRIGPKHVISRMNKGIVLLYDLNDKRGAVQAWEEALRIDPNIKNSQGEPLKMIVNSLKKEIK